MVDRASSSSGRGSTRQAGFALLIVLWASVVIALLAGGLSRVARNDVALARNLLDGTRAELAADSGVHRALWLVANGGAVAAQAGGAAHSWRFETAEVRVAISDETGRIDLNAAPGGLVAALFQAAGVSPGDALALAEAVMARRGGNGAPSAAEPLSEKRQAGFAGWSRPGGGAAPSAPAAFTLSEELLQLPGMSPELYARVQSAITVHAAAPAPRRNRAPALVVAALEGRVLPDEELAELDRTGELWAAEGPGTTAPIGPVPGAPALVRLQAQAVTEGGSVFVRTAVVSVERRAGRTSLRTLLWQRGRARSSDATGHDPASAG